MRFRFVAASLACGAFVAAWFAIPQRAALAVDESVCKHIYEQLGAAERAHYEAETRLAQNGKLITLNKQIDELAIKEADEFLSTGKNSAATEAQLAKLRRDYKEEAAPDKDAIARSKHLIDSYHVELKREKCEPESGAGGEQTAAPVEQSAPAPLDTGGMTENPADQIAFQRGADVVHLKSPASHRWVTVGGNVGFLGTMGWLWLACPKQITPGDAAYECDMTLRVNGQFRGPARAEVDWERGNDREPSRLVISWVGTKPFGTGRAVWQEVGQ